MATSRTAQCDDSVSASVEDSLKESLIKKRKDKHCICPISDDQIQDVKGWRKARVTMRFFGNGMCQSWLHRGCAGRPPTAFEAQVTSNGEFFCPTCHLNVLGEVVRGPEDGDHCS